jgi:hypothetical protein
MISVGELEARLRERAEELVAQLLPAARREGNYCKVGSVEGDEGASLVVYLAGERRGRWQDFAGTDHGDMLDLIEAAQHLAGKGEAVAWAKRWLGIADDWRRERPPTPDERRAAAEATRQKTAARHQREIEERANSIRRAKALYLGRGAVPIDGTPAEAYLRGRLLEPAVVRPGEAPSWPGVLRFHPAAWHGREQRKIPAMLAAAYLPNGMQVATHRTFLQNCPRRGWTKIDSDQAKLALGPIGGGFIPINKGSSGKSMQHMSEGEPIYCAEGIENALVVRMRKPDTRIIAAYSVGNIGAIVLPPAAKRLVIVCDRDENEKAQLALEQSIARQQARGVHVQICIPPVGIKDFNDWLILEEQQARGQDTGRSGT